MRYRSGSTVAFLKLSTIRLSIVPIRTFGAEQRSDHTLESLATTVTIIDDLGARVASRISRRG